MLPFRSTRVAKGGQQLRGGTLQHCRGTLQRRKDGQQSRGDGWQAVERGCYVRGVYLRCGFYGREGEGGHLHPSVAERKTWEYKRRKPADAGFC